MLKFSSSGLDGFVFVVQKTKAHSTAEDREGASKSKLTTSLSKTSEGEKKTPVLRFEITKV